MQDINQNMDDLFRRAAADYPLKLNESQWDDIAPVIEQGPAKGKIAKANDAKKTARLASVFILLLLISGLMTNIFKPIQTKGFSSNPDDKEKIPAMINKALNLTNDEMIKNNPLVPTESESRSALLSLTDYSTKAVKPGIVTQQPITGVAIDNESNPLPESDSIRSSLAIKMLPGLTDDIAAAVSQPMIERVITGLAKDSNYQQENPTAKNSNNKKKSGGHQPTFYIAGVAGPLFNEVKKQGLKKTGFSAGIIAGYQFKNQVSIETGLLYAQKPYFSTGQYFSMDKIGSSMPVGMEILSLEGDNHVLEIPVKVKYDFLKGSKKNFFLAAGITSYIQTHEKNNYLVLMNGVQQSMISSYKNKSRSLAATFDISTGYEHKIGPLGSIRIEPYLQIPLKGMGVGSMPMISTGIRLGLTKFTN
jgi:hypothetical protein